MGKSKINCEHTCKITCEALNEALERENDILEIYKSVIDECNLPEVKSFLNRLITEKEKLVRHLLQKLDEMKEKSHIIDDIAESYNKEVE
jgi:rubrerythrin